jgi:hypothetical protein
MHVNAKDAKKAQIKYFFVFSVFVGRALLDRIQPIDVQHVGWGEVRTPTALCAKCWGSYLTPTYELSTNLLLVLLFLRVLRSSRTIFLFLKVSY